MFSKVEVQDGTQAREASAAKLGQQLHMHDLRVVEWGSLAGRAGASNLTCSDCARKF